MQLTREAVARKLASYLHHEISLNELVTWANVAMMEANFEEAYYDTIRDAVARLGLADVLTRYEESTDPRNLVCGIR